MWVAGLLGSLFSAFTFCHGVPPSVCHEKFNWRDCGKEPTPVIYYWKPGSRCEVGLWRGCLPAVNLFRSEVDCVATCIFNHVAHPDDYHQFKDFNENDIITMKALAIETTTVNDTLIAAINGTAPGDETTPVNNPDTNSADDGTTTSATTPPAA